MQQTQAEAGHRQRLYSCFFYGTLMHPRVLGRVAQEQQVVYTPVTLPGYLRFRVKGQDYPGLIAAKDAPGSAADGGAEASVAGMLVTKLSAHAVTRLDAFEGDEYCRVPVTVVDKEGTEHACETYLYKDATRLGSMVWDFEEFKREKLAHWTGDVEFAMLQGDTNSTQQDGTNGRSSFT